jgi:hypothetical protein
MHKAVAVMAALIVASTSVQADWEFTRWGMTVTEVERASRFSAIRTGLGYGCMMQMQGPYTFLGVRFDLVRFCFDDDTLLESVDLLVKASAYDALDKTLRRAYGPSQPPRGVDDKPGPSWTDLEHDNRIDLFRAEGTILTYRQPP